MADNPQTDTRPAIPVLSVTRGKKSTIKQVSVTTTATKLIDANNSRLAAIFRNLSTSTVVYIGDSTVTTSTGMALGAGSGSNPGDAFTDDKANDAWYGIVSSGTASVSVIEVSM